MNYEEQKKVSDLLIKELEPVIGKDNVNNIIFNVAPSIAHMAHLMDITPDDVPVQMEGKYHPAKALMIQLIKAEAWCHYYSMVDDIAC